MAVRDVNLMDGRFAALPTAQKKAIVQISAVVLAIVLWEVIGQSLGENLFAPFSTVVESYVDLWERGAMVDRLVTSVTEMFMGFGLAVAFAVPVGLLMGRSRAFDSIMNPWVSAFFATSTSALLPLLIVVVGIDLPFRLAIIWLASVWHVLLNVYHGARGVNEELIDVGRSFDASSFKIFKDITLPALVPFLVAGLRMGITRAIRGFILAETYIRTGYGGFIMDVGNQAISTAPVLALIINIMLLGYVLRRFLDKAEEWLAPWASDVNTAL
jgi:NitT/TauT family transport system permease protein